MERCLHKNIKLNLLDKLRVKPPKQYYDTTAGPSLEPLVLGSYAYAKPHYTENENHGIMAEK